MSPPRVAVNIMRPLLAYSLFPSVNSTILPVHTLLTPKCPIEQVCICVGFVCVCVCVCVRVVGVYVLYVSVRVCVAVCVGRACVFGLYMYVAPTPSHYTPAPRTW
jgi:hypothetical protein